MEVLRPSTPMPYARVTKCGCFKNRRYPSSASMPHLQPLIEERFVKRSKTTGDLVKSFQRCTLACDEGENVEFLQLSSGHANVLRIPEKKLTSKFTCRLPCINKDDKSDFEPVERHKAKQKLGVRNGAKFERETSRELANRSLPNVSSSQSSNSLPGFDQNGNKTQKLHLNKCKNSSTLQKHIEQEDKNFDPEINKEVLFQKYFEGQR